MKRIIYSAAIAALLVVSCQKTDVLNVVEDTIDFSTQVGKLTKAGESYDKLATLKDQDFRVWTVADFNQSPDEKGKIYRGMKNLTVHYDGSAWGIVTDNDQRYFWPQADNYLYFYTISAKNTTWLDGIEFDAETNNPFVKAEGAITGLKLPVFTVINADDDVMVSNHIRQTKKSYLGDTKASKEVKPYFRHTMTKVEFNFRKGGAEVNPSPIAANVVLKSIKISPVFNAGVLNVTYGDDVAFTWTPENTTEDYEYVALEDAYITNGDVTVFVPAYTELPEVAAEGAYCKVDNKVYQVVKVTGAETEELKWEEVNSAAFTSYSGKVLEATEGYTNYVTWYMIPQGLGDDQVVTITYIADGKTIVQDFALTVNNTTNKDWTEETCVKYNVTIAPHKITFTPSVNPWTEFDSDKDKEGNQDVEMEN